MPGILLRPPVSDPKASVIKKASENVVRWNGSLQQDGQEVPLFRLYHRDAFCPRPNQVRRYGPVSRYDHHANHPPGKTDSVGSIYLARTIGTAVAEVFGEASPAMLCDHWSLAKIHIIDEPFIFNLSGVASMKAGAYASILALDRLDSQAWAREIYKAHRKVVGIHYLSSHDYGECLVIRESGEPHLQIARHNSGDWDHGINALPPLERVEFKKAFDERGLSFKIPKDKGFSCGPCADPNRHP